MSNLKSVMKIFDYYFSRKNTVLSVLIKNKVLQSFHFKHHDANLDANI